MSRGSGAIVLGFRNGSKHWLRQRILGPANINFLLPEDACWRMHRGAQACSNPGC
jgi:hypothetical protein